jgi:YggT family protein
VIPVPLLAAIDRDDVARYVNALFIVFIILIFARIAISWVVTFRGSIPYNRPLRAVTGFIEETVDPYLNLFRRLLPTIGGRSFALDLSPMIGIIVLFIVQAIVVGLIEG